MKDKVRDAALRFLCDAERDKKFINLAVSSGLALFEDRRDKALFTLLVYGVTERSITLDYYISKFS
ncbi:MAG: 16S rRNA (cytosine(967)-C(5))-methyltransferase RsmB, partial [Clostridia bacterium]|nr:16S rRNA (cytosine(967)-C(5))-methyltransferase RsmB [Clostridia bacterium]